MFDRDIRRIGEKEGYSYLFSCMKDILLDTSIAVANLEGPITHNVTKSMGTKPGDIENMNFTFAPAITDALLLNNIGYVNIGNNHILNFGKEGLVETKNYLTKAGIRYFGEPNLDNATNTNNVAHIKLAQKTIALVNYNQFWYPNATSTENSIKQEKLVDNYVVIYAHWGEEYASSTSAQRALAHGFIDSGADFVTGSHPHVVQERELYKGKYIFYSLGNFIFDQWFSEDVMNGLAVRLTFQNEFDEPLVEELPIKLMRDGRTCPVLTKRI